MEKDTAYTRSVIALVQADDTTHAVLTGCDFGEGRELRSFANASELVRSWKRQQFTTSVIIIESEIADALHSNLTSSVQLPGMPTVPVILLCKEHNKEMMPLAMRSGVAEIFVYPLVKENIELRVNFLAAYWKNIEGKKSSKKASSYRTPFLKRAFDIFFAGLALLLLLPLLIIIYLWIRLESKGPAFYYSYRVGTGYKIFKFYKFRSMFTDADKRLKELKHLNMYQQDAGADNSQTNVATLCDECRAKGVQCQFPLYADEVRWCEKEYSESRRAKAGSAFFKFKDDPRITRAGKFIRNTSIDELPQLWNVIIGDMSIVGNRPLPLYEAEKLTTDKYALRFLAPAGITGLWQVEKRGKGEMSEEERLLLDNKYAQNFSFWYDIKLILKTIPALFQKENV